MHFPPKLEILIQINLGRIINLFKYFIFFPKHLVLLGQLNWKLEYQSLSFSHWKGLIWRGCIHFCFLTSWCAILMFSIKIKKKKRNPLQQWETRVIHKAGTSASLLRPIETGLWIYTLDQPERDREPVLAVSQKGRQGLLLKDMEHF